MSDKKKSSNKGKKDRLVIKNIQRVPIPGNRKKADDKRAQEPEKNRELSNGRAGLLRELIGEDVLLVLEAPQLNILGQTFRPVFTGTVTEVSLGHVTLSPVIIKMPNAPFYEFPTPLSFALEKVVGVTRFDPETIIPVT